MVERTSELDMIDNEDRETLMQIKNDIEKGIRRKKVSTEIPMWLHFEIMKNRLEHGGYELNQLIKLGFIVKQEQQVDAERVTRLEVRVATLEGRVADLGG